MHFRHERTMQRGEPLAITLLRLAVGVIFVVHGTLKLSDIPGTTQAFISYGVPLPGVATYLAISGEFLGGLGILVGLFTRAAALGTLLVMLGAIGFVHAGNGLLGRNGGWEYPLVLSLVSMLFISHGAGSFSIDALRKRLRKRPAEQKVEQKARPVTSRPQQALL
jgi:putative oxidoreductase